MARLNVRTSREICDVHGDLCGYDGGSHITLAVRSARGRVELDIKDLVTVFVLGQDAGNFLFTWSVYGQSLAITL